MERGFKTNKLRYARKLLSEEKNAQDVGFALLKGTNSCMEVSNVAGTAAKTGLS
jgi:hypothetical protein